ncbi:MAG TPA: GAF domain-containing protein [Kofleriaceae bacterium]|nr:GAF domain-containing protein [Kofleriaceae bacterium]
MSNPALKESDAIAELARVWRKYEGDPDGAIRAITETAARELKVARASVWLLDEGAADLTCIDLYETEAHRHSGGTVLRAFDYPAYFAAMLAEEAIAADDAHADRRTLEFSTSYLRPLGIGALLDAPIRTGPRLVGVLCHEHIGPPRSWTAAERQDAAFLASLASLTLELKSRARREALLAATLESTGEGILATDDTRVIAFNQRFVEMWQIDAATMRSFEAVRRHIAARSRPAAAPAPAGDPVDTLELVDGRVFERTSRPQIVADRVVGRVWSFRDVTAQRRAEALAEAAKRGGDGGDR